MTDRSADIRALARRRWWVALGFTGVMVAIYFGFILLVAFNKPLMARLVVPGVSLGILIGALVIVAAWLLTLVYTRWAGRVYDAELDRLGRSDA